MKNSRKLFLTLTTLFFISFKMLGQNDPQPFDWDKFHNESSSYSNIQFSPDGDYLLYLKTNSDLVTNKRIKEYKLLNLLTRKDSTLTFNQKNVTGIQWSPKGNYMSFLALEEGKMQLFLKNISNGKVKKIGNHPTNISSYYWNHAETKIVFTSRDKEPEKDDKEKHKTAFEVGPHGYLNVKPFMPSHIYLLDISTEKINKLTDGSWTVNSAISWSPNDQQLVFSKKNNAFPSDWNDSKIMVYNFSTKSLSPLSNEMKYEFAPEFTPTGNNIIYWKIADCNPAGIFDLFIKNGDKPARNLTKSLDRNIYLSSLLPGNDKIICYGPDGNKHGVWIISLKGKINKTALSNKFFIRNLAVCKKGGIAVVASFGNQPSEIFYFKDYTSPPVQLTHYNEDFKNMELGRVETIEWKTDLDIVTNGIVTYPPNFTADKKYPLVLFIHGGPTASSLERFSPFSQEMARNGWIVFEPNYRGSNNLGDSFQEAIMNDGGEGPGRDVIAGIETLKKRGYIDETKIAVSGWSYGGFMTAWLIGKYPDVWAAAVAGAAPVDYTDMTSLSSMNLTLRHAITNSPWVGDNYQIHYNMSPLKFLSKIKTPTLIMSKVEDQVVTVTGSYKLYHALLANDIPTQFIAYPGGGHFPSDPVNSKDVYDRWLSWLKKYLD
jgi:dipeptidyl aminopeptidase/acylaminoacyl peptidase